MEITLHCQECGWIMEAHSPEIYKDDSAMSIIVVPCKNCAAQQSVQRTGLALRVFAVAVFVPCATLPHLTQRALDWRVRNRSKIVLLKPARVSYERIFANSVSFFGWSPVGSMRANTTGVGVVQ